MAAVGGSIESVSISGREFAAAADAEAQVKIGGSENEVQPNGDGVTSRMIKTKVAWSIDGLVLSIDDDNGDLEFLQEIADGNSFVPIAATFASGIVRQGSGQIVGELQNSSQKAAATVNLAGPGQLTAQ